MANSRHDFFNPTSYYGNRGIAPGGTCASCHVPHGAQDERLWTRLLAGAFQERSYFLYTRSNPPNYIPAATVMCYDCHDDGSVTIEVTPDPPWGLWDTAGRPQDIALNGTRVGYSETACGQKPAPGNLPVAGAPTGGHYWKSEPGQTPDYQQGDKIDCALCHDPHNVQTGTNDAFFRSVTWDGDSWEPLNAYGTNMRKSKNSRAPSPDTRDTGRQMCATCHGYSDQGVQKVFFNVTVPKPSLGVTEHVRDDTVTGVACTDCHGHNQIAGCNSCHGYPPMLTEAEGGGTFSTTDTVNPNRRYVENYTGGAGAHRRHKDALAAMGTSIFKCELCHGPRPGRPGTTWHNEGCGTFLATNVDVIGLTSYAATPLAIYWGTGSSYTGNSLAAGFTDAVSGDVFAFRAKGGGDQRCANLSCHGRPPDTPGALNWQNKMVDDTPGPFPAGDWFGTTPAQKLDSSLICKWCHDGTPAKIGAGPNAPNVLGTDDGSTSVWNTATNFWGADVSGHGKEAGFYDDNQVGTAGALPAANVTCTVCHDARYTTLAIPPPPLPYAFNTPIKPHLNGLDAENRLRGTINGAGTPTEDAVCDACHQNGAPAPLPANYYGKFVSTHGNNFPDKSLPGPDFTRSCRQCHDVHGANWNGLSGAAPNLGRNLHMVGKWIDANNNGVVDPGEESRVDSNALDANASITTLDAPVIFTTNTGENSYDDGFGGPETTPAHESVCVVCHVTLAAVHGPDNMIGSVRTRADLNTHNPIGGDCIECHKHNTDNDVLTADSFAPSGCYGCHGTNDTEPIDPGAWDGVPGNNKGAIRRQFWPDGKPRPGLPAQLAYSDDQTGAHKKHVAALALDLYGETEAQLVTDNGNGLSVNKQKSICAFCHADPGGAGHSTNGATDPLLNRANVYRDTDDTTTRLDVFKKLVVGAGAFDLDLSGAAGDQAYNFATDSCANLVCHNRAATPAAASTGVSPGWNWPPDWSVGINTRCSNTTCHAPATYQPPVVDTHYKHVGATQKNYECLQCHVDNFTLVPATNPIPLGHGNGEVDMQAEVAPWLWSNPATVEGSSFGGANGYYDKDKSGAPSAGDTGFAYRNGVYDATCNAIYCHGDDNAAGQFPFANRGTITRPRWGFPADANCTGTCHKVTAAVPPGTLSHPKHAGNAAGQYSIGCQACHYSTTNDGTSIASMALHVNTSAEVNPFNALGDGRVAASSTYGGDTVMGSGYGSCAFTYCHSRGNDTVAPYNDVPLSVPIAAPLVWGQTGACSSCHGNPAPLPTVDPSMPDYAHLTPKANRHAIHNTANDIRCEICHYPTTQDGTTIVNAAPHVNRTHDAGPKPNAPDTALYQFTWAAPNCNAVVCHGGNGTVPSPITWSTGPYTCDVCHGMVNGVATNTDVDDFAWAGATPTMSKISNSEYTADGGGHGDNTAPGQPNRACADCHDSSQGHDTTAALSGPNPFRLVDQDGGTVGVQYSCSAAGATPCHTGGSPIVGPQTGLDIRSFTSHTPAAMLAGGYSTIRTWPGWLPECLNCHDPHGDNNLLAGGTLNRSMVNRWVYDKGAFPLPAPAPAPPTEQLSLSFTDSGAGVSPDSYANSADYSGICQECHERTGSGATVSFHDGPSGGTVSGANHPSPGVNPGDCSNCHMHDKGFAPMACRPCHSAPPYPGVPTPPSDDAPVVTTWYDLNGHGSKSFDPDGPGPQATRTVECTDCHDIASPNPSTHLTGRFETYTYSGSPWGGPNTNTSHLLPAFFGSVGPESDWQVNFDDNCFKNIYCHRDPPAKGHRHELTHGNGVVRFGNHTTVTNPKLRSPAAAFVPWTIKDISTDAPPGTNHYGPCVSCHDPHGVDPAGFPYCLKRDDGNLHMVKKDWCDESYFCNSNCHRP